MDRHGAHGTEPAEDLRGRPRAEMPGPEVRPPRPDRQQRDVDAAREPVQPREPARVTGEVDRRRAGRLQEEPDRLRARRPRRDPVAGGYDLHLDPADREPLAGDDLDDFAVHRASRRPAEPARDDDGAAPGDPAERPRVEVVGVAVRDEDRVDVLEPALLRRRAVPLERARATSAAGDRSRPGRRPAPGPSSRGPRTGRSPSSSRDRPTRARPARRGRGRAAGAGGPGGAAASRARRAPRRRSSR